MISIVKNPKWVFRAKSTQTRKEDKLFVCSAVRSAFDGVSLLVMERSRPAVLRVTRSAMPLALERLAELSVT